MNSKQRVLTALHRHEPDRVPLQFDLCRSLLDRFGKKLNIPVRYTTSYYEDVTYRLSGNELRIAMGSDCVVVGASLPAGYSHPQTEDGCIINEFGMKMRQGALYMEVIQTPLSRAASVDDVNAYHLPDPLAPGRFADAEMLIQKYQHDYFIIGDVELTLFEMAWHLTGMEKFMLDMSSGEDYIDALLDKVMTFSIGVGKKLVSLGVDGIWTGDDFGAQNGMIISPRLWRKLFKPRYKELWQELKAVNPEVMVMYHSDGAVAPILNELAEIGMEVFNPVQPNVPGHDPQSLKDSLGSMIAFWGAIDQQALLPSGTPAQIAADVAEKIRVLGKGGGYMAAPAHIIQADTSMENVEAFIAAVKEFGDYR